MAKFKVGDKVKILDGSVINNYSGGWTDYMSEQIGKISEIIEVCELGFPDRVSYRLKDLYCFWDERGLSYAHNSIIEALPTGIEVCRSTRGLSSYEYLQKVLDKYRKVEKKMPTKFTFYVTEGTRPDKNPDGNGKGVIPTMTTNIELLGGNIFDKITTIRGSATCDKEDYDERQGVLEALANAICEGNFDKAYNKEVKKHKLCELHDRTCLYCGKVFDTIKEREAHEAWHVERKKARRERYLLRKRAKEIAFEEQAQKMAKEIIVNEGRKKT